MGGAISDLRLEDGGDCCIRCEGGTWSLTRLRLRCSHGAALLASHGSRVTLNDCILGGEGEDEMGKHVMLSAYGSVQEQGLSKRACYALVLRNEAVCHLTGCQLRECSEAALLVAHRARALLARCRITLALAGMLAQVRGWLHGAVCTGWQRWQRGRRQRCLRGGLLCSVHACLCYWVKLQP